MEKGGIEGPLLGPVPVGTGFRGKVCCENFFRPGEGSWGPSVPTTGWQGHPAVEESQHQVSLAGSSTCGV